MNLNFTPPQPQSESGGFTWYAWSIGMWLATGAFSCTCGRLPAEALIPSLAGAILAWVGFLRHQDASSVIRMVAFLIVLMASYIFLKNLADVLWYGHNALLR